MRRKRIAIYAAIVAFSAGGLAVTTSCGGSASAENRTENGWTIVFGSTPRVWARCWNGVVLLEGGNGDINTVPRSWFVDPAAVNGC